MRVTLGSHLDEAFTKAFDAPFETITRSFSVTTASSAHLVFEHYRGDNIGLVLDNVQVHVN